MVEFYKGSLWCVRVAFSADADVSADMLLIVCRGNVVCGGGETLTLIFYGRSPVLIRLC